MLAADYDSRKGAAAPETESADKPAAKKTAPKGKK
jgi:hypothetical protein